MARKQGEKAADGVQPELASVIKHWYAAEAFTTMYQGMMLKFIKDQLIDVPGMGEYLHAGGSPVEQREG